LFSDSRDEWSDALPKMNFRELLSARAAPWVVAIAGLALTGLATSYLHWEADRQARAISDQRSGAFAMRFQTRLQGVLNGTRSIHEMVGLASADVDSRLRPFMRFWRSGSPTIRWIAVFAPAGSGKTAALRGTPAGMTLLAAGEGAAALEGDWIKTAPAFAATLDRVAKTGKNLIYAPQGESGIGVAVHLCAVEPAGGRGAGDLPMVLAVAVDIPGLIGSSVQEFRRTSDGRIAEKYALEVLTGSAGEPQDPERVLFSAAAENVQPPWAGGDGDWLLHESTASIEGIPIRNRAAIARADIRFPEEHAYLWGLAAGLLLTLLAVWRVARYTKSISLAEDTVRRMDSRVRGSEERFRNLAESTRDWVWECDAAGVLTYSSRAVQAQLGYSVEEVVGRRCVEFGFPFPIDSDRAAAANARCEVRATRRDGKDAWLQCNRSPMHDEQGGLAGYRGVCIDITEDRRNVDRRLSLEREINRLDKLGTLDHIMSMVAHELNQPLTAVSSYCGASIRMLRNNPASLDEVISTLSAASSQAQAAAAVVRAIRRFIVRREPNLASHRLQQLAQTATSLVEFRILNASTRIETVLDDDLPPVLVDDILIVQVLLNLLHNALDAIAGKESCHIRLRAVLQDTTVSVCVEDNGSGMTDEQLERCFDSYVTTKPGGLGLGLSISRAIVESHGGELTMQRNEAGGCTASFSLEVAVEAANSGRPGRQASARARR